MGSEESLELRTPRDEEDAKSSINPKSGSTGASSDYKAQVERDLVQKQAEVTALEGVVDELNAELSLAQQKLSDILKEQSNQQMVQSDQIGRWREEQQQNAIDSQDKVKIKNPKFLCIRYRY